MVGARCAGAPLAMLLARRGHSVSLLDRARMPADTLSTHWIRWPGVQRLHQWDLLDRLVSTGCPPLRHVHLDFDSTELSGAPTSSDGVAVTYAPRRTVLDHLLVDEACRAGAELRDGFTVRDVVWDDRTVCGIRGVGPNGRETVLRGRLVVGADGRNSTVARAVHAPFLEDRGVLASSAYGYWRDVPPEGIQLYIRGRLGISLWPTNGELTVVSLVFPRDGQRGGAAERYLRTLSDFPEIAAKMAAASLSGPVRTASVRNARRHAHGPGWVLAGDAGHHKDPVTAQGISDAFADAAALADALHPALAGEVPMATAMTQYAAGRDSDRLAAFGHTCDQAALSPLDDDFFRELDGARATPRGIAEFLSVFVGSKERQ